MNISFDYRILIKHFNKNASQKEEQRVSEWETLSEENHTTYLKLKKIWNETGTLPNIFTPDPYAALRKVHSKLEERGSLIKNIYILNLPFKIAASLLLLIGLSVIFFYYFKTSEKLLTCQTDITQVQEISLSDGSVVSVNKNSKLTYPAKFNSKQRRLRLIGEAYFSVTKDSLKPFIVDVSGIEVRVLGTEFNIRSYSYDSLVIIHLNNGKVRISDSTQLETFVELAPGEQGIYNKNNKSLKKIDRPSMNPSYWHTHILNFHNTELCEVVKCLSEYYNKNIIISDSSIRNRRITATFNNQTFASVTVVLEEAIGIRFSQDVSQIIISDNQK